MRKKPPKTTAKRPPKAQASSASAKKGVFPPLNPVIKTTTPNPVSMTDLAAGTDFAKAGLKESYQTYPEQISITKRQPRGKDFTELGIPGLEIYSGQLYEEFLPELRGSRGVKIYKEMISNDPTIGGMLYAIEQLIQRASMKIVMPDMAEADQDSNKKMDLIESSLHDMTRSWSMVLSEIMTFLAYGYNFSEVTLKQRNGDNRIQAKHSNHADGLLGWRGIELRGQESTDRWEVTEEGDIIALWQLPAPDYKPRRIPLSKGMLFRVKALKNSPEGISILRNSYRPWVFKKRYEEIEGIALERELTGLPVLTPPEGYNLWNTNDADASALLQRANDIVRNVRMDQHMGVVLPHGWTLDLKASSGQRSMDTTMIIGRLEQRMAVSILADMLLIGQDRVGSFALVSAKIQLFSSALTFIAKIISDEFNRSAIPRLLRANGFSSPYPIMKFGPIESIDLKALAEFFNKGVSSGMLTPTENTETYVRQLSGLPEIGPTDVRRPPPGTEPLVEPPKPQEPTTGPPKVPNAGDPLKQPTEE